MGLDVTGTNVDVWTIGTTDSVSGVGSSAQWTISWYSTGYVFKKGGSNTYTMQVNNASTSLGTTVSALSYSASTNCRWGLTKISTPPSGAYLYRTNKNSVTTNPTCHVEVGKSKSLANMNLCAVAFSETAISQSFTWSTSNSDVATVDSNGTVTGKSAGKAVITGRVYRNSKYYYVKLYVCVGFPSFFNEMIDQQCMDYDNLDLTFDGLFISTTPMSEVLSRNGIYSLPEDSNGVKNRYVNNYYDDWYLFAIITSSETKYGLFKMREQETDTYDGNDPGVTIPFISFDLGVLNECIKNTSQNNRLKLLNALDKVTGPGVFSHDKTITAYFANTYSNGPYLIAEKYVAFIAKQAKQGVINAPDNLNEIYDQIDFINEQLSYIWLDNETRLALLRRRSELLRVPNALDKININAGWTIYNKETHNINIKNANNLSLPEKQAILACFTADVTFNSFAAEVEFHADALNDWKTNIPWIGNKWYEAALRADMAIGEEYESGFYDDYYDLSGPKVKAQAKAHGEY